MDLQMPVMGGMEATQILRNEMHITTPIIALSANAFKNEIDQCMKIGMNAYVTKPFEEKQLLDAIIPVKRFSGYQSVKLIVFGK